MAGLNLRRRTRIALAGAGALVASMSVGCQGGGTQFASPFSPYRDSQVAPVHAPASPAFAQVQAGQNLPVNGMARNGMPAMPGQPIAPPQPMMVQQPIVGSGGMVYPIGYNPAMNSQMMPAQHIQNQQPNLVNGMPVHPMMPNMQMQPQMQGQMQGQMMPQYQPQMQVVQGQQLPPQMTANTAPPLPAGTSGQVQVSVIQGPNGPQYVYTEIVNSPNAPLGNGVPNPTTNNTAPYPTPAPAAGPAGNPAPTFDAPLPNVIPAPALPTPASTPGPMTFVPAESNGIKPPETLPPAVSVAPAGNTGASLPGMPSAIPTGPTGPTGSFPISP